MWFRGMHYSCWGEEDGGEELRIEMNGGVLWGRPRPGRGCSTIDGWMDGVNCGYCILYLTKHKYTVWANIRSSTCCKWLNQHVKS
jgi:hypothetical protein